MILTIEATHTTITHRYDPEQDEFVPDPLTDIMEDITLYRDIPTLAAYAPSIADTEVGILASNSPKEFVKSITNFIEQMEDDNPYPRYDEIYWEHRDDIWAAYLTLYEDDDAREEPKWRGAGVDRWYIEYTHCDDDEQSRLLIAGDNYRQEEIW
jgi:hypothetical protein